MSTTIERGETQITDRSSRAGGNGWIERFRPPGLDVALLAALFAVNAFTGGALARLEFSGSAIRLSEISLVLIAVLALHRHGIRRSVELLRERAALPWLLLLLVAVTVAFARGVPDVGFSRVLYDIQLYDFIIVVPLIVLVADTRVRARWLLAATLGIAAVATLLFLGSEAIARASESAPLLADGEGEVGAGALYACMLAVWALASLARPERAGRYGIVAGALAMLMIGLADKRTAWVALVAGLMLIFVLARGRRIPVAAGLALFAVVLTGSLAINAATEVPRTAIYAFGPLEGNFEDSTDGWSAYGSGSFGKPVTTQKWSARGDRSLRAEFASETADGSGYVFARSCCAEEGGLAVDPGVRYVAEATVRVEEAPAEGIDMQLHYYRDDGTYRQIGEAESSRPVRRGELAEISVVRRAPRSARIVGIQIGPSSLDAGERATFEVDSVALMPASEFDGNLHAGGNIGGTTDFNDEEEGSQLNREFSGLLGGQTSEGQNVEWRVAYWGELLDRLGEQPSQILTGAGFGPTEFERGGGLFDFRTMGSGNPSNVTGPHNVFVATLYLTGVVGLIGLIGLIGTALVRLLRALGRVPDAAERATVLVLLGLLIVSVGHMSLTEALRAPEQSLFLWAAVGLGLAWTGARAESGPPEEPAAPGG